MPVLIALAFQRNSCDLGNYFICHYRIFWLAARFYLDQLRLLLVPRLAAILTVVIILMIFISIFSQNLGLEAGTFCCSIPYDYFNHDHRAHVHYLG